MPLDGNPPPNLSTFSLEALAWLLEHSELPKWNFRDEQCCGIGVALDQWGFRVPARLGAGNNYHPIFMSGAGTAPDRIGPGVVAGRIRDHLAGRPIRYLYEGDRGR